MSRALKIVSRHQHPEPRGAERSASKKISTRVSSSPSSKWVVGETDLDLSTSFPLKIGPGEVRSENRKERIALETINKLVLTVSHYLSNPLTILLARVELLSEATKNGGISQCDIKKFLDSCRKEIHRIDLIIKAFQNLSEVRYKTYPPGVKMLDVEKEIKNRLKEIETFTIIKPTGV